MNPTGQPRRKYWYHVAITNSAIHDFLFTTKTLVGQWVALFPRYRDLHAEATRAHGPAAGAALSMIFLQFAEQMRAQPELQIQNNPASNSPAQEPEPVVCAPKKHSPRKNIDARMLVELRRDTRTLGWSLGDWAKRLGCSRGTVAETRTWKKIIPLQREAEQAQRRQRAKVDVTDD